MQEKTKLRIGGVPEHFNLPIHLAIEKGEFKKSGIDIRWIDYEGGTGQMTKALRNDELDVCVVLSEGIIADIIKGNPSRLISIYVKTPLCWGIHTGTKNSLSNYEEIFDKKYAISRYGSGSHLMAIVDANSKSKKLEDFQFVVINNLKNALNSLSRNETDVFYWEKFTTKPYVDSGKLKRIGEFYSPWPCFVIAASEKAILNHPDELSIVLKIIHQYCDEFMNDATVIEQVSDKYKIDLVDAEKWYHSTEWSNNGWISDKMVNSIVYNLRLASIIEKDRLIPELIWKRSKIIKP